MNEKSGDIFEREQEDICSLVWDKKFPDGRTMYDRRKTTGWHARSWSKFSGDAVMRIVMDFLSRHVEPNFKVVGPGAYIEGHPIEYDLLIVEHEAIPLKYTTEYPKEGVRLVVEVKKAGIYHSADESERKEKEQFNKLKTPGKPVLFLCVYESNQKQVEVIRRVYRDNGFVFEYGRGRREKWVPGEWRKFIDRVSDLLNGEGVS